jgi:beta-fructofuranosidase
MRLRLEADHIPQPLEVEVLRSPDGEETTKISFYRFKGGMYAILPYQSDSVVTIDTTKSSSDERFAPLPPETLSVVMQNTEELDLRIFVDKSVVEVFMNDKYYSCMRAYPTREDSKGVSILARGGDGVVSKLEFHNMKNTYEA